MKKKSGFTLQEVLIAMVIVGVIAAVTVPGIVGLMPNENKLKFLKAYKNLTNAVADLADDPGAYYKTDSSDDCIVFYCKNAVLDENGNTILDPDLDPHVKFAHLFSRRLSLQNDIDCSGGNCVFTTTDNVNWSIGKDSIGQDTVDIRIIIDVTNGQDTAWPITIDLDDDGGITVQSQLGKELLKNPTQLKNKDIKAIVKQCSKPVGKDCMIPPNKPTGIDLGRNKGWQEL